MKKNGFITIFLIIVTAAVLPFTMFVTVELNNIQTVKNFQMYEINGVSKHIVYENLDKEKLSNGEIFLTKIDNPNTYVQEYANETLGSINIFELETLNFNDSANLYIKTKFNLNTMLNSFKHRTVLYENNFSVLWKEDFYEMDLSKQNFEEFDLSITNAIYPKFYNYKFNDFPLINTFGLYLLTNTNLEIEFNRKNGYDIIDYDLTFKNMENELVILNQSLNKATIYLDDKILDKGNLSLFIDMTVGYWSTSTNADGESEDVYTTKRISHNIVNFGYINDSIENRFYIKEGEIN